MLNDNILISTVQAYRVLLLEHNFKSGIPSDSSTFIGDYRVSRNSQHTEYVDRILVNPDLNGGGGLWRIAR